MPNYYHKPSVIRYFCSSCPIIADPPSPNHISSYSYIPSPLTAPLVNAKQKERQLPQHTAPPLNKISPHCHTSVMSIKHSETFDDEPDVDRIISAIREHQRGLKGSDLIRLKFRQVIELVDQHPLKITQKWTQINRPLKTKP